MLGLFPDYLSLDLGMDVSIWKEQFPISTVALFYRKQDALTHRDILGSLMGLSIKRELIGEILTAEDFAVIFCTQTAQQIILSELERVGKRLALKKNRDIPVLCRKSVPFGISKRNGKLFSVGLYSFAGNQCKAG